MKRLKLVVHFVTNSNKIILRGLHTFITVHMYAVSVCVLVSKSGAIFWKKNLHLTQVPFYIRKPFT